MKAIIPVAGNGTRLYPLTLTTPKPLIRILNKPIIEWSIENLIAAGITEVILIISADEKGEKIREFIMSRNFSVKIQFVIQEEQLGTAHALKMTEKLIAPDESFIYIYGDDLYGSKNIQEVIKYDLAMVAKEVEDYEKWGICQVDDNSHLVKIVEKPQEPIGKLANIGVFKLNYSIFAIINQLKKSVGDEYLITDAVSILAETKTLNVIPLADYWIPIGYPWHILDATSELMKTIKNKRDGHIEENVMIRGKLSLPASSTIKSGTYIEGNLVVGENCDLGPHAYFRKDVVIGDNSHVGAFVEIKNSVIGQGTKIPHLTYIGDSVIGNHVNISVHNSIANWRHDEATIKTMIKDKLVDTGRNKFGTIIGDNVKTGMGTKILPGRKIWPGMRTKPGEIVEKDLK
ncbi:MAG: bifunctional sugar-1-phosphate nucleotidylyltransferase/acetyltransferase [bacterium]